MLTLHVCDCQCLSEVPESLKYSQFFLWFDTYVGNIAPHLLVQDKYLILN